MKARFAVVAAAFLLALLYFSLARGYPPGLAALVAAAVAALTYTAYGTVERLRALQRARPTSHDPRRANREPGANRPPEG